MTALDAQTIVLCWVVPLVLALLLFRSEVRNTLTLVVRVLISTDTVTITLKNHNRH
jgi:hypothetical protein